MTTHCAILALLLLLSSPAAAQTRITVNAEPKTATVGDPIRIDIEIPLSAGSRARILPPGQSHGEFAILEFEETPGEQSHRAHFRAAVYQTGELEFPPVQVLLTDAEGNETTAETPPIAITIQSVLTGEDDALKDLKKQAEITEPFPWLRWLGIGALLLALAALAWWLFRRKREKKPLFQPLPRIDPFDRAEAQLRELLAQDLPAKGQVKQFYVALSDIVRAILEAGYGIHTVEKTTSEIMETLAKSSADGRSGAALRGIESFLRGSDMVKFAKYIPSPPENDEAVAAACRILADCRKMREPAPAPAVSPAPAEGAS